MPVIPRFRITQNDDFVIITVSVPYVRVAAAELEIDGAVLAFYCKPYLLKLTFPEQLVDDERAKAEYDPNVEHGTLTVYAPKAEKGKHFPDLDLTTRLLQPAPVFPSRGEGAVDGLPDGITVTDASQAADIREAGSSLSVAAASALTDSAAPPSSSALLKPRARPLIEVVGSEEHASGTDDDHAHRDDADAAALPDVAAVDNKNAAEAAPITSTLTPPSYGFNRHFTSFFADLREEIQSGLVALPAPDATPNRIRPLLRIENEESSFDVGRYAGDYAEGLEDPVYLEATAMVPWWLTSTGTASGDDSSGITWSESETGDLASLPNKEFLIDEQVVGGALGSSSASSTTAAGTTTTDDGADPVVSAASIEASAQSTSPSPFDPAAILNASSQPERFRLLLGLVSILYAYCYDHRTTGGEGNVESGWTMATLSPLLSWLDDDIVPPPAVGAGAAPASSLATGGGAAEAVAASTAGVARAMAKLGLGGGGDTSAGADADVDAATEAVRRLMLGDTVPPAASTAPASDASSNAAPSASSASLSPVSVHPTIAATVTACMRRCLTYPYMRRWDLAQLVAMDAATLLMRGRRYVLRSLLHVRKVLAKEEHRYLLNVLFLNDYCVWIQALGGSGDAILAALGSQVSLASTSLSKEGTPGLAHWRLGVTEGRVDAGEDIYSDDGEEEEEEGSEEEEESDAGSE